LVDRRRSAPFRALSRLPPRSAADPNGAGFAGGERVFSRHLNRRGAGAVPPWSARVRVRRGSGPGRRHRAFRGRRGFSGVFRGRGRGF
jgi:hypothetical protein